MSQIPQHQRNADVDSVSVAGLASGIGDFHLKETITKTVFAVNSILEDCLELDEEAAERFARVPSVQ